MQKIICAEKEQLQIITGSAVKFKAETTPTFIS